MSTDIAVSDLANSDSTTATAVSQSMADPAMSMDDMSASMDHDDGMHDHGAGHNPHEEGTGKHAEHSAVFDLVAHVDATHVAVSDGSWFDPATWANGVVPGDDARVLIAEGVHVTYDGVSGARLFTVRVDGHLDFATDRDSKMVVDTMVVDGVGRLTIGTEADPVAADVNVDIVIANNGAIDVTWDPQLLSRGIISHGAVEMHGQEKTTHLKVATDPMTGDTSLTLSDAPEGWQVGDTLVLAGTRYDGYKWSNEERAVVHHEPEDEILTITRIEGNQVFFDTPLQHDHDAPRADLKTSVANYSRNITIATEDPDTAAVHERGHVMFMHSDDVDVRYAEFHELGRTDKSEPALNASEFEEITPDANVKGRYSFHFHRTGTEDQEDPAIAVGNAVFGSPGWGFVHHDSHAVLHDNASYNTFGAGFVAESGNETGSWTDNIAIYAQGAGWGNPKIYIDVKTFDTGRSGDGFWFQSRLVDASGNIAASVNNGFSYVHRGRVAEDAQLTFDAADFDLPEALGLNPEVRPDDAAILNFHNNETFAAHQGLIIVKANPNQGHDVHSHLKDFTAWSVQKGAHIEYTAHYILDGFDLVGKDHSQFSVAKNAISTGGFTSDVAIINARIDGFETGIHAAKASVEDDIGIAIFDPIITNTETAFSNINPTEEVIQDAVPGRFEIHLDGPLTYNNDYAAPGGRKVTISGIKIDSLGEIAIPAGSDSYDVDLQSVNRILEETGFYEDADGNRYFVVEAYYSDRLTGEIFKFGHLVEIHPDVRLDTVNGNVKFAGLIDLDSIAPEAHNEQAETQLETDVVIDLLANDSDADDNTLEIDGILQPLNGTVFNNGDGTVTYRPDFDFTGTDSFKYWVTDGQGNFTPAIATIQVGTGNGTPAVIDAQRTHFNTDSLNLPAEQGLHIRATNTSDAEMHSETYSISGQGNTNTHIITNATAITGSDLDDIFDGFAADETFHGADGDDLLIGGGGDDDLRGGDGNDTHYGGDGSDDIRAGAGDDILAPGAGGTTTQNLFGQAGNDTYVINRDSGSVRISHYAESIDTGTADRILFEDLNPADLSAEFIQTTDSAYLILAWNSAGISGQVQVASEGRFIEYFEFQNGAILNTEEVVRITMGLSEDTYEEPERVVLRGNDAGNILTGGAGADLLDGKGGADTVFGGAGDDRIFVDNTGDVIVEAENGGYEWVSTSVSRELERNVESATALGTTNIDLTGNDLANWLNGNNGKNVLVGGAGNDRLNGKDGNDLLDGGTGQDVLEGGAGDDRIFIDNVGDNVIEHANGGYEWIDTTVSRTLEANVESANAIGDADVDLTGNSMANWLVGNAADNVLSGGDGRDRLDGRNGNDLLDGGNDNDILDGGAGSDIFFFENGDGTDVVRDFTVGIDQISFGAGISFEDLAIRQTGENTNIQYTGGMVVVTDVTNLQESDLIFQS